VSHEKGDPANLNPSAGTAEGITEVQRQEALLKTGALQKAILNSANFSSIATDEKGVIQIFNVGAERMLGYAAADVVDKITPADISDPEELIARAKALSAELSTPITPGFEALVFKASRGIEDIYELTYIRKDGSRFPAIVSVTALRDDRDAIIGYLLIGTDNTARKAVEADQRQLAQRLRDHQFYTRSLFESNIDALMTTDPSGIITDVNKQMEALTGCTRDELIGAPFKSHFTDPDRAEAGIKLVLSEKRVNDYELTARSRDDKETAVSLNATTFYDRDRRLEGVFAAARDVTERKRLDQVLQETNVELESANKELEAFSYSVSHDLRAPVRAIDGFSRIVMDDYGDRLDDEGKRQLGVICANTKKMGQLIDDLLAFSRIGRAELRCARVAMGPLVHAVFLEVVPDPVERERIDLSVGDLPDAWADPALIRQIWVNLLSNAVTFSRLRPRAEIKVSASRQDNRTIYHVGDNGIGFDMQYVGKLFGVFQRLHSTREFEGTGVGLALVQRIVHRHGGEVWGEGTVDGGATFSFALPEEESHEQR
jgi:PAS domain S-box-containing protein